MPDNYDQPTDMDLVSLATFWGTPAQYSDWLSTIYPSYGKVTVVRQVLADFDGYEIRTATGGWSGCEEIDRTIQGGVDDSYDPGMFRLLFWESDHRGGLTKYRVPVEMWDKQMFLGTVSNSGKVRNANAG